MDAKKPEEHASREPLKSYRTIFEQEIQQAVDELKRPAHGLFMSGFLAGFGVGLSALLVTIIMTLAGSELNDLLLAIIVANSHTVGFIIVIMGRTDLFTEYTTIAILPVLTKDARLTALGRLWGLVYLANLIGGSVFALLAVVLGPALKVVEIEVFGQVAHDILAYPGWVMLLSGTLTGWFMGFLSWLITAGRETISQVFFIWLITGAIALGHLHHVITGAIEVLMGLFAGSGITPTDFFVFLLWVTLGNALGGVAFAVVIRYSILLSSKESGLRGSTKDES